MTSYFYFCMERRQTAGAPCTLLEISKKHLIAIEDIRRFQMLLHDLEWTRKQKKNVVFTGLQGSWMLSNGHRMQTRILAPKRKVVCSNHIRDVTRKSVEDFVRNSPMLF